MNSFRRSMIWFTAGLAGCLLGCARSTPSPARPAGSTAKPQFDVESGPFAAGKKVMVASGCFQCHSINGLRGPVPDGLVASLSPGPGDGASQPDAIGSADDEDADIDSSSSSFRLGDYLAQPLIRVLDRDKDGQLTKDEVVAGVKQFFKNQDKDKTGKLTPKEISDGLTAIIPTPQGFWGARAPAFGLGELFAPGIVRRADADKDGKVTEPELVAAAQAYFEKCDGDKKGKLGEKEIAKALNRLGTSPENTPKAAAAGSTDIRSLGPDLGTVGQNPAHTVDWFKAQIRQPKSHKTKARMPSFEGKIKDEDLSALAEYLTSMK